ncbi:MAG: NAD(P)-binding domain-containing protein, partial [Bdellovibrionales bacterium]|nr:NAD(P)-binding domain-containing protein [Bdellovibrionales bacterium]
IDPDHYIGKKIVIVGAGNSALEAAKMLAHGKRNNEVIVLIRGKAIDRANDENREDVERLEKQGRLKLWFESQVKEIYEDRLVIAKDGEARTVGNDFLFVFAGAEKPYGRLAELGITIEKKFGEAFQRAA